MHRALMAVAFLGLPGAAFADSAFTVDPTRITLTAKAPTALLTVRNESSDPLRFQLSVFVWTQTPNGEMDLAPTEDIVFFPPLFEIGPRQERRVRIGTTVGFGAIEKSYRIFVEELPSSATKSASGAQVKVLTRMGIPIFMRPASPTSTVNLSDLGLQDGRVRFEVKNLGNVHVIPRAVRLAGVDAGGSRLFTQDLESWYILAGGARQYLVDLAGGECRNVRRLEVQITFESGSLTERLDTPVGVCRQSAAGS